MKVLTNKNRLVLITLAVILLVHAIILFKLIFFPYPELFIYPYLTEQGLLPYKQIIDQHFPGLMFLPINLNNLGMTDEYIARWWLVGLVVFTQILLFLISSKIFNDFRKAILVNIFYLIWQSFFEGWVLWIDSFLSLFYLPAFYFCYQFLAKFRKRDLMLCGLFLSISLLFKQVAIPLAILVFILFFYFRPNLQTIVYFLIGFLPIPLLMVGYFYFKGIFGDFWFWTVTFNLTTFAKYGRKLPFLTGIIRVCGVYSPILLLNLCKDRKLVICLLVFIAGSLTTAFARFDFVHFQPSLPFIAIASSAVLFKVWEIPGYRLLAIGYFLMTIFWLSIFYKGHIGEKVFFFDENTKLISSKIRQYVKIKEEIFLFGPVPHLYQMSNTIPAGKIFVFQFPWFIMETEDRFIEALRVHPPNLIVRDRSVIIEDQPIIEYAKRLDDYVEKNYYVKEKIGVSEFMLKK